MSIHSIENLFYFEKDKFLRYTHCNEGMAEALGLDSPSQVIGKSDFDLIWKEHADLYRGRDSVIIRKKVHKNGIIEPQRQQTGNHSIAITKAPVLGKNSEAVGITGFFTNIEAQPQELSEFEIHDNGKISLGCFFGYSTLSIKEFLILKEIINGRCVENTLTRLGIKKTTYGTFMERLKAKMGCESKGDIIASSIQSGLVYFLQRNNHLNLT